MKHSPDTLRYEVGPCIAGRTIKHNTCKHQFLIEGLIIDLSPTEYRLVMELFLQLERCQAGAAHPTEIYVCFDHLQQVASLPNRTLLRRHISNASTKLWVAGCAVARVDGYGYTLLFEAEGDMTRYMDHSLRGQLGSAGQAQGQRRPTYAGSR
jgi:hypothetical protein